MNQPGTQMTRLHCGKCDAIFNQRTLTWVQIKVWTTHMRSLRCPNCGATWRKLNFVTDEKALRDRIKFNP